MKVNLPTDKLDKFLETYLALSVKYFENEVAEMLEGKEGFDDSQKDSIFTLCLYCYERGGKDTIDKIDSIYKAKRGDIGKTPIKPEDMEIV